MAEKLDSFDWSPHSSLFGESKYDQYLDGGIYRLVRGEDFDGVSTSIRTQLYARAKKRGLKLRSVCKPEALVVQAYKIEEAE